MKNVLLVIDVQNGFINEYTKNIKNKITDLLSKGIFDIVIATKYKNSDNSNFEKILNWKKMKTEDEQKIVDDITKYIDFVIEKNNYSGYTTDMKDLLIKIGEGVLPDRVFVLGFDTDGCVLSTIIDLFDNGIRPILLARYCASTGGDEYNEAGMKVLKRMIGKDNIIMKDFISKEDISNL